MISVIIPVYNNEETIEELLINLVKQLSTFEDNYEIICVDDASVDSSLKLLNQLRKSYSHLKVISLPRNTGQHAAIFKGMQKAIGEWIIMMDADGQDDPKALAKLLEHRSDAYDAVFAKREKRKSSLMQKISSNLFYLLWQLLGNPNASAKVSNFGVYRRSLVDAVLQTGFPPFSMQLIALKLKAPLFYLPVIHIEAQKSSYNFASRWKLATQILYLYSFHSLKRILFAGIILILIANSILVRFLLNGKHSLKWPLIDTLLMSIFISLGGLLLFLFFNTYRIKKDRLRVK